jgi:C_GCAxxG_C_C family probable redox protein
MNTNQTDHAAELFNSGYSCAQAVFMACRDLSKLSEKQAFDASGAFGGGVGGMELTCGALCGAMMVLYERHAPDGSSDADNKRFVRLVTREFGAWFEQAYGTTVCSELKRITKPEPGCRACSDFVQACARRLAMAKIPFLVRSLAYGSPEYEQQLVLRQTVLRAPLGLNLFDEDLSKEADAFHLGAFVGDKLIGTLFLSGVSPDRMHVRQVAVDEAYRKIGAGRLMMLFAHAYAKEQKIKTVFANVRMSAKPFYDRLGYTVTGDEFTEVTVPHVPMEFTL